METPQKIIDRQIQQKADFIDSYKKSPIIQLVCGLFGIARSTFYRWIKGDPVFYQQYLEAEKEGREILNDAMESYLIKLAKDDNLGAVIFYLKHNHPRYSESFGSISPHDIEEVARYIENSKGPQNDFQFLSKLFYKRVPVRIGRYILQVMRRLSYIKSAENERKKIEIISKIRGKNYQL